MTVLPESDGVNGINSRTENAMDTPRKLSLAQTYLVRPEVGEVLRTLPHIKQAYSLEQWEEGFTAWEILLDHDEIEMEPIQQQQVDIACQWGKPLSLYTASPDPDVLHLHEALCGSDRKDFLKAMDVEKWGPNKVNIG